MGQWDKILIGYAASTASQAITTKVLQSVLIQVKGTPS